MSGFDQTRKRISLLFFTAFMLGPQPVWAESAAPEWQERITIGGDLRFRHEYINFGNDGIGARHRERVRVRIGLDSQVSDTVKAKFRFATGGDSPVSTNATFDNAFSTKDFGLDRAYLLWTPQQETTSILLGKMPVPFIKMKEIIFDNDLSPEGAAGKAELSLSERVDLLGTVGALVVEERADDADTVVYAGQAALRAGLAERTELLVGGAYYHWEAIEGEAPLFDPSDSLGNTLNADGTYATEFGQLNAFSKLSFYAGLPMALHFEFVKNTRDEARGEDTAYEFGLRVGKAREAGSFQFDYLWREIEADSVIGAFADSNFGGGETNADGHEITGKYMLTNKLQLRSSIFLNDRGIAEGEESVDHERVQIDLVVQL